LQAVYFTGKLDITRMEHTVKHNAVRLLDSMALKWT